MLLVPISEHVVDERLELPGASRSIAEAILGERRTEATTFSEFLDLCAGPAPRGRRFLFGAWQDAALTSAEYWGAVRV